MAITRPSPQLLRRGLLVMCFNTLIALGLMSTTWHNWDRQLVYAHAVGLSIWVLIETARATFLRRTDGSWPQGWRLWLAIGGGILGGNVIGTVIGDAYSGNNTWQALSQLPPRAIASYLLLTTAVALGVSYFFVTRSTHRRWEQLLATSRQEAAENQLRLLQSQLEPHMLFNTLANLRVMIAMDPPQAQAMLDHLIGFLRGTLSGSRHLLHTLTQEFAAVDDYLALMKIRMGDRLRVELVLPAELGPLAVPTLLLQPLVENAIKHGLEPQTSGGLLRVNAQRAGDTLLLQVQDTGTGLPAALDAQHAPTARAGTHFGLEQVKRRLRTLYGDAAELQLAGNAGGCIASVRIPWSQTQ